MDPSALSVTARELRDHLASRMSLDVSQITIGHPGAAVRQQEGDLGNAQDLLNLFFYRVEYDGYPADGTSDDPFYARAFCLITAFSISDAGANGLSAGEKDLRAIGGVMHWLHKEPFLSVRDAGGADVAALQVVPGQLSLDDLNHIWATQGDLPYRLSVSYEFALLPVPIAKPVARQPRVGSLGLGVGPDPVAHLPFHAPPLRIAVDNPDWEPAIRFVDAEGGLHYALSFTIGSAPPAVQVTGAGLPGTSLALVWEHWESASGWQSLGVAPEALELTSSALSPDLDPRPGATSIAVPSVARGQLQLTAQRVWRRPDGASVVLRSNPLLISLYEESSP